MPFISPAPLSPLSLQPPLPRLSPRRSSLRPAQRPSLARRPPSSVSPPPSPPPPPPPSPPPSCFGRGKRLPRRAVGLYELQRLDIDPFRVFADGNTRSDAAFGAVVAAFVLCLLGAPLVSSDAAVEAPVALAAAALLCGWALDALLLDSAGAAAAAALLQPPRRVASHEAGHLLVSYLCGVPVTAYALPRLRSVWGGAAGVEVDLAQAEDKYALAAVGMAGVAAECLEFGSAEGGAADFVEVCKAVRTKDGPQATAEAAKRVARWGLLQAALLITEQEEAHKAVAQAMRDGRSIEECIAVVERTFNWSEAQEVTA